MPAMAEGSRAGEDWDDAELGAIVADHFAMLEDDLAGRPFNKAAHNRALQARIGRSRGSIEFKHQNLSAVLDALGLPWVKGYVPMPNFQNRLFDAVGRHLERDRAALRPELPARPDAGLAETGLLFAEPPPALAASPPRPEALERLVRRFDPAMRDLRNRVVGEAGERAVLTSERARLVACDRPDLARKVRWVAQEDGDGAGYDIHSYDPAGSDLLIEVKTTVGGARTPFFLTRNERDVAEGDPVRYRIHRLYDFARSPRLFELRPPLEASVHLATAVWEASFGRPDHRP